MTHSHPPHWTQLEGSSTLSRRSRLWASFIPSSFLLEMLSSRQLRSKSLVLPSFTHPLLRVEVYSRRSRVRILSFGPGIIHKAEVLCQERQIIQHPSHKAQMSLWEKWVIVPAPSFCAVAQRFFQRERQALRAENSLLRKLTLFGKELTKSCWKWWFLW